MHNVQLCILQVTQFVKDYLRMVKSHAKIQQKANANYAMRQHYVVIICRTFFPIGE